MAIYSQAFYDGLRGNCLEEKASTPKEWKRRRCVLSKVNQREGQEAAKLFFELEDFLEEYELFNLADADNDEFYDLLVKAWGETGMQIISCYFFPSDFYNKLKPYTQTKQCQTYDNMLSALGFHGHAQVVDKFGFTKPQLEILSELLFGGEPLSLKHDRRGTMSPFEATLLVCAKLRFATFKGQEIGRLFGRDPSAISAFTRLAIQIIIRRFVVTLLTSQEWFDINIKAKHGMRQ